MCKTEPKVKSVKGVMDLCMCFRCFWKHKLILMLSLYSLEFPANEIVRFLVGFTNKGIQDFTVQSLEASFRYPQDFQFYIQNVSAMPTVSAHANKTQNYKKNNPKFYKKCFFQFTALPLDAVVKPQTQASFEYSFIPAQPMAGRPFILVILLNYLDTEVYFIKLYFWVWQSQSFL